MKIQVICTSKNSKVIIKIKNQHKECDSQVWVTQTFNCRACEVIPLQLVLGQPWLNRETVFQICLCMYIYMHLYMHTYIYASICVHIHIHI